MFKEKVRRISVELGLPYEMFYRDPFPGPGLGVRILGEVSKEYGDLLRQTSMRCYRKSPFANGAELSFSVKIPVRQPP